MSNITTKRLTKELRDIKNRQSENGITLLNAENLMNWTIQLKGATDTIYQGETFVLQMKFADNYPLDPPEVVFTGKKENIPVHPHVYSNGHICLSILYDQWSPALNINSICLSILSMLSSCKKKERPADNDVYINTGIKSPKDTLWAFHDDKI